MSEEQQAVAAEAAPEPVDTASTVEAPVSGENTPETKVAKTFTQEELDEIVAKRVAKEARKAQRNADQRVQEALQKAQVPAAVESEPVKPVIANFQTVEEYDAAMEQYADKKVKFQQANAARQESQAKAQASHKAILEAHAEREDEALEKYDDYHVVTRNPRLPITNAMADAIVTSDIGHDIAYFLGKNIKEAERIAALSPIAQAREIGKLEAKIIAEPPAKKTTAAPAPLSPLKARGESGSFTDTTDPKSLEKLGTSAWIEADRQRRLRELKARHH